ncbi:MAG: DUF2782 domain-containing protein [Chromatiales bacterium]|nr:DUF2782 domain-containing protein [Chromatiales bacterium]
MRLTTILLLSLLTGLLPLRVAMAADLEGDQIPPPLPEAMVEEGSFEPEVTIIKRKETLVEEYRHNGTLYMIKITPKRGYPYYLIDSDGDGSLETRRNERDNPEVVQWRLFSW